MIEFLLALLVIPISLPALSLLLLTLAALRQREEAHSSLATPPARAIRVAVLVPAHNESAHILPTLECVKRQLGPNDRLLVIADNCTDDTALLARGAAVQVIERHDDQHRGKGYALAFGVAHLYADPPDVVLVVDADCLLSDGAVACIALRCSASGKPVQMLNLMTAGAGAPLKLRILEFAMLMKNLVRPLGSFRLGGACHLMGTGMALPWALMSSANLATGHITEDMKLGVELAVAGYAPEFLPQVRVSSAFPLDTAVAKVQKSRWEHGHLATLTEELPRLLVAALKSGQPALLVMAMDLLIPPVALYFILLAVTELLIVSAAVIWPVWLLAAGILSLSVFGLFLAIGLAWWGFGRHLLSGWELMRTPLYALWKLPVYLAYFLRKRSGWVRTQRESK